MVAMPEVTYSRSRAPLRSSRFVQLPCRGFRMLRGLLAALFVSAEVGDGDVGLAGGVKGYG